MHNEDDEKLFHKCITRRYENGDVLTLKKINHSACPLWEVKYIGCTNDTTDDHIVHSKGSRCYKTYVTSFFLDDKYESAVNAFIDLNDNRPNKEILKWAT